MAMWTLLNCQAQSVSGIRMERVFYFNYLPEITIMSTIKERSEANSLASTPILTYSEPNTPPASDIYINLSEPSLQNVGDDVTEYIKELKGNIKDMKSHIHIQNRYIEDLTEKYENSLDTIVELNNKIHQLERDVQTWRVRARSQELSSSMLKHDVNELRDTIVLLRRENIEIIEHTPVSQTLSNYKSDVKIPDQKIQFNFESRSTNNEPKTKRSNKKGNQNTKIQSTFDVSGLTSNQNTKSMPAFDLSGLTAQSNNKSSNATRLNKPSLLKKRVKRNQPDIPNLHLDFRSIRQRPINQSSSPLDTQSSINNLNHQRLPSLSFSRDLSKQSKQFRKSTPRPSSLTDIQTNDVIFSRLELTSSKCIHSPRTSGNPNTRHLSQIVKGNSPNLLSRRPYT
ncbi:hypothetical protein LOTGIDRAFT_163456 [Lottia gigantea]|uniref:Uncharacterized protein n=1 Tax=Lottia gigantea TaxID=225164 RepID=V4BQ17_LOTGI|nr:hypothetical protein LOTGIDRAFT_163456 [Lottia gigantea]ESO90949.1 hypothetical protein LOTGIDRAFT_163456 [Lottia gigantea]